MTTLYLVVKYNEANVARYIGYVLLNGAACKVMEASIMEDVNAYMKMHGYTEFKWRVPKQQLYQMIRVKEW